MYKSHWIVPIVADLKTMDGGYLEAEMMARAGATHVVVMAVRVERQRGEGSILALRDTLSATTRTPTANG